jgi:hypothetical protein
MKSKPQQIHGIMKSLKASFYFMALIAFSGCATDTPTVLNQPVGPARSQVGRHEGEGELVVYSAPELVDPADSAHPTHSSYTLYNRDGKILRRVDNRSGSFYQGPVAVSLPAGTYKVAGRATNNGLVIVPVVIEGGRTTILDLDGSTLPQSKPQPGDQWVRLPDGQVIGNRVN